MKNGTKCPACGAPMLDGGTWMWCLRDNSPFYKPPKDEKCKTKKYCHLTNICFEWINKRCFIKGG